VAYPHPGIGQDPASADPASGGAEPIAEPLAPVRPHPAAGTVLAPQAWLSTLTDGAELRLSRVAAFGHTAQVALRLGQATECLAALEEQRAAAGHDQTSLVWALSSAAVCRSVLGQLRRAREDLAQARQACNDAAPLLAEPFWRFAQVVCNWQGGNWAAAEEDAAVLDASTVGQVTPALATAVTALRMELLRGLGRPRESQRLATQLAASPRAEIRAWALAGLDADQGQPADALRRLTDVLDDSEHIVIRAVLPLVLHRMAETAFSCGNQDAAAYAASGLARLDQAAPLVEILAGLAEAYATGDPQPARHAQRRAEAEGAGALAAEALTVRGRIGDTPIVTFSAAHAAWRRIGALGKAGQITAAMRASGLPAPAAREARKRASAPVPGEGPAPLTPRERSLATLVHEGRTNQQIASVLNISVKTVEACLTRLYRKTSCTSRVELAVAVTERRVPAGE
jgi:DNA-binding CsgD family transcriptional regulator